MEPSVFVMSGKKTKEPQLTSKSKNAAFTELPVQAPRVTLMVRQLQSFVLKKKTRKKETNKKTRENKESATAWMA